MRKSLKVGVLSAGILLFAASGAQADFTQVSADNDGIANGTQIAVPIQVPVNACGIGVGVIGVGIGASGVCANGAAMDLDIDDDDNGKDRSKSGASRHGYKPSKKVATESTRNEDTTQVSGDNDGILNGTQVYVPIQVPINACGIGVGVIGVGVGLSGVCGNGAAHDVDVDRDRKAGKKALRSASTESSRNEDTVQWSQDNDGIGNGTQVYVPIQVPINACGIGVGVIGVGAGLSGACLNGAIHDADFDDESTRNEDTAQVSKDNDGILNGTQVYVPIQVPINACGIGVGVIGVGLGLSGACVNGAAQDIDHDDDDNGNGNGNHHYKGDHKGGYKADDKGGNGYTKQATTEALPDLSAATAGVNSAPVLGQATRSLPLGGGNLGSGLKTSKVNVAGVDPMSLLDPISQAQELPQLPAGAPAMG
jgi:hypothetical protein